MSIPRTPRLSLGTVLLLGAAGAGCSSPRRAPVQWNLVSTEAAPEGPPGAAARRAQATDPDAGYRTEFFAADGIYLGARGHWSSLGDDFDGDTTLVGPADTIEIPDAGDGTGYELALGWLSRGWAMELSYSRITYDGTIASSDADVDYEAITWNFLRYLRCNEPLQPYFVIGFVFPWAELEDASLGQDAELDNGFGVDGGLGLAWWFGANLALDVRALYTYQFFEEAEGAFSSGTIDDPVYGSSFGLSVGLTWALGKRVQP